MFLLNPGRLCLFTSAWEGGGGSSLAFPMGNYIMSWFTPSILYIIFSSFNLILSCERLINILFILFQLDKAESNNLYAIQLPRRFLLYCIRVGMYSCTYISSVFTIVYLPSFYESYMYVLYCLVHRHMWGGGGVLLKLSRVSARCHFHKSLNWARLVHYPLLPQEQLKLFRRQ